MSEPMSPEEMSRYWTGFIDGHIPNFAKTPFDQIDNYVKECWANIVNTAIWAEKDLPGVLRRIEPDLICVDNVILFPATKRYGVPWVRIISCSENEIPDPDIPPHLSGCGQDDRAGFRVFEDAFNAALAPVHGQFNDFLERCGETPYPIGQFFEASPYLNLLLYPEPVRFKRRNPLDPKRFQYLEGCVRQEAPFEVPAFDRNDDGALIYISFGSLGCGDTDVLNRIIKVMATLPYRVLVNVGDYSDAYRELPPNVQVSEWLPQPSVIAKADLVIHHGGNNTCTECLYFGKPAIIMPFVWDGHDNATRIQETGHGLKMHRGNWSDRELVANIETLLSADEIQRKLTSTAAHMRSKQGTVKAAELLSDLVTGRR